MLRIYIFYDPLSYTLLTEHPNMTGGSLLSSIGSRINENKYLHEINLIFNLGGALSLLLGVSVLSLFEIFEVVLELYLTRKKC